MYFTPFICETPRLPSETLAASDPGYPSPQWRGEDSLAVPIGEGGPCCRNFLHITLEGMTLLISVLSDPLLIWYRCTAGNNINSMNRKYKFQRHLHSCTLTKMLTTMTPTRIKVMFEYSVKQQNCF